MAKPGLTFAGFLYDDAGDAINGATINLYAKNATTTSLADTTTNSSGYWTISHTPASGEAGEYDVQVTSGASKRRIKFDDGVQLASLDAEVLSVRGNEGAAAAYYMFADEGEDAGDRWKINVADGGVMTYGNDINSQGTYVTHVTITPNSTVASSTVAIAGHETVGGDLTVTGATTLNGNVTLGDAASDVITVNGTLAGANALQFEGATADGYETTVSFVDPTADRTIYFPNLGGYLPVLAVASTTAISATPEELNIMDGVTSTAAEINLIDGGTSRGTTAVASGDGILINDAGTMRMTNVDTVSTYFSSHNVGGGNIVTTGALNSGSITSGFGTIDTGSSTITTTGLITGGSLDIDNVLINGATIGHTDDTDLMTVADGVLTVAGEVDATTLDISGAVDIDGAADIGGTLTLGTVAAAGSDVDKFLVLDGSGNVDYRTGTEVLSDIGGGTGGMTSFQLEDDDGTEVTISNAKEVKIIGSGVTTNWTDTDNGTDGDPYDLTITVDAAQTGITSVYNASLKVGRDADNLVDFATTDNKIILRVEGVDEVELVQNALSPVTSDGVALGTSSLMWSDLFVASGGVINFNNGDMTLTHSSNTVTVAGGTLATAALTASTGVFSGILKTDDATEATSTTDGSLQTDGGLSVVKDAVFGDDVKLLSDSSVLAFGADGDVTVTHDADKGLELNDSTFLGFASAAGTPATDDKVQGIVVEFLAAEAITAFDAVYVSTTTGRVGRADANDAAKLPAIGIAIEAQGSAGSSVRVLTHGVYRDDGGFGGNLTVGADLYTSETPGTLTATAPGDDGDFVQLMGVAVGVRSAFINPDLTIIEVA